MIRIHAILWFYQPPPGLLVEGETVRFHCHAHANPPPETFAWWEPFGIFIFVKAWYKWNNDVKKWYLSSTICMEIIAGLWTVNAPMALTETFSSLPTSHRATTWPLSSVRYILDTKSLFFWALSTFFWTLHYVGLKVTNEIGKSEETETLQVRCE